MFQYHLMIYMLILCIPSLGIILPINYSGNVLGRQSSAGPGPGPLDLGGSLVGGTELRSWESRNLHFNSTSQN